MRSIATILSRPSAGYLRIRPGSPSARSDRTAAHTRPVRPTRWIAAALLSLFVSLSLAAAAHDSVTVDEFSIVPSGYIKLTHPGEVNYGSAGIGSTHHLTMEAMKSALRLT